MSEPDPGADHRITLYAGAAGVRIEQHRPCLAHSLRQLSVERALTLIPRLLPVCGAAQRVAGERAVLAAMARPPEPSQLAAQESELDRERARALGWRLAIDWADLLGQPRRLGWLRDLRSTRDDAVLASLLRAEVPGLATVDSPEALAQWAGDTPCDAARVLQSARSREAGLICSDSLPASEAAIDAQSRRALEQASFDPLAPVGEALEVGPLARSGHRLLPSVRQAWGAGIGARFAALVLDIDDLACALAQGAEQRSGGQCRVQNWSEAPAVGTGRALTARGPVYHRVQLGGDDGQVVEHWRVLAPTDWHFAPRGPVARALEASANPALWPWVINSFDPCAPWQVSPHGEAR